ncbi:MAG: RecB family exonuclease [Candidatus Aminicenantia bacterium]
MNKSYSISKIQTFDQCKLQYKYKYIERKDSELETIEAFLGNRVHKALREFYESVKHGVIRPQEWLISKYSELWEKNYHPGIKIVHQQFSPEDYFNKGKKCLIDYYNEYQPFNQGKIVRTEQRINFWVKYQDIKYPFNGIIDRLDWNDRERIFEIHDYKTSGILITQQEANKDWQMALYHLAIMSLWPEAKKTKLIWHYLLFNKEIISFREEKELEDLQKSVIEKIKEIESCQEFSPEKSALCDWCDYQDICPLWKHPKEMEKLEVNEYRKDPGVRLVAKYSELEEERIQLKNKIEEIEKEQEKIKQAALELAERENIRVIDGPDKQLQIVVKDELCAPTKSEYPDIWKNLRSFLIQEGKYEEVSTVNNRMLNYQLNRGFWPEEFIEKIKKFLIRKAEKNVKLIDK